LARGKLEGAFSGGGGIQLCEKISASRLIPDPDHGTQQFINHDSSKLGRFVGRLRLDSSRRWLPAPAHSPHENIDFTCLPWPDRTSAATGRSLLYRSRRGPAEPAEIHPWRDKSVTGGQRIQLAIEPTGLTDVAGSGVPDCRHVPSGLRKTISEGAPVARDPPSAPTRSLLFGLKRERRAARLKTAVSAFRANCERRCELGFSPRGKPSRGGVVTHSAVRHAAGVGGSAREIFSFQFRGDSKRKMVFVPEAGWCAFARRSRELRNSALARPRGQFLRDGPLDPFEGRRIDVESARRDGGPWKKESWAVPRRRFQRRFPCGESSFLIEGRGRELVRGAGAEPRKSRVPIGWVRGYVPPLPNTTSSGDFLVERPSIIRASLSTLRKLLR